MIPKNVGIGRGLLDSSFDYQMEHCSCAVYTDPLELLADEARIVHEKKKFKFEITKVYTMRLQRYRDKKT